MLKLFVMHIKNHAMHKKKESKIMPKISTIIPVYNVEPYIKQTIDSVLNQTLDDIEIILVNDGSTDNSGIILDEYAGKYPNCHVYHQKNQGQAVARNNALRHATGEYITFLDADDYIPHDAYEKLYNVITREDTDLVVGDCLRFNNEKVFKSKLYSHVFPEDFQEIPSTHIKEYKNLVYDTGIWRLVKKSFLDQHNLRFAEGLFYEDILFSIQLHYLANSVSLIPDVVYYWRSRNTNVNKSTTQSKAQLKNMRDRFLISNLIKNFQLEHKINDELIEEQYYKWLSNDFLLYIDILDVTSKEYQEELLENINKLLVDIPSKVFNRLRCIDKFKYDLIKEKNIPSLLSLIEFEKTESHLNTIFKNGKYIINTPNTELDVTNDILDNFNLEANIISFKETNGILTINGTLNTHNLSTHNTILNTQLINLNTNKQQPLENTYDGENFTIKLAFEDIYLGDNRILLDLETPNFKKFTVLKNINKNINLIQQYTLENKGIRLTYTPFKTLSIYSIQTNLILTKIQTHKDKLKLKFNTKENIDKILLKSKYTKETLEYPLKSQQIHIPYKDILKQEWTIQYQTNNKIKNTIIMKSPPYITYQQKNKISIYTHKGKIHIKTKNESKTHPFIENINWNKNTLNISINIPQEILKIHNIAPEELKIQLTGDKTKNTFIQKIDTYTNNNNGNINSNFLIPLKKLQITSDTYLLYICSKEYKQLIKPSNKENYKENIMGNKIITPHISKNNNLKISITENNIKKTIKRFIKKFQILLKTNQYFT